MLMQPRPDAANEHSEAFHVSSYRVGRLDFQGVNSYV